MLENANIDAEIGVVSVPSPGRGTFLFLKTEGACPAGFSAIGVRGSGQRLWARKARAAFLPT